MCKKHEIEMGVLCTMHSSREKDEIANSEVICNLILFSFFLAGETGEGGPLVGALL